MQTASQDTHRPSAHVLSWRLDPSRKMLSAETSKMVAIGSGARRDVKDYQLSEAANQAGVITAQDFAIFHEVTNISSCELMQEYDP
jgi:hypothetical protein